MNHVLKAGVAGALALAGVAAHASIANPGSGSSDAILFAEVVNAAGTAAVASYAGDTGVSVAALTAGGLNKTVLAGDANLQALFNADAAGDSIQFAVLGGQYTGNATPTNFKNAATNLWLTTTSGNVTSALDTDTSTSLSKFAGLAADVSTINSNSGGANSIEGTNPATSGVWDITNTAGLAFWDGGSTPNFNVAGTTSNIYKVTAGTPAANFTNVVYSEVETATLTSAAGGLVLSGLTGGGGGTTTTPLPAAVWLLGSGLLGLTGVARRKSKA